MGKTKLLFWDVDTQADFMEPGGKLYVPDAFKIIPVVNDVRRFAFDHRISLIASTDWHTAADREISPDPDFESTYPEHCLAGTPGAQRVGFLGDWPISEIPNTPLPDDRLRAMIASPPFHLAMRHDAIDVFSNPNVLPLLKLLLPENVIVFGVALDVCVKHAVDGLIRWGRSRITVLADAVKGLRGRPDAQILQEWKDLGIHVSTLAELKKELLHVVT